MIVHSALLMDLFHVIAYSGTIGEACLETESLFEVEDVDSLTYTTPQWCLRPHGEASKYSDLFRKCSQFGKVCAAFGGFKVGCSRRRRRLKRKL